MRVSTRILIAWFLLTGLWTWSGAAAVCEARVELSAAQTCCPDACQCPASACGCSMAPAEPSPRAAEAPMLMPESFQPGSQPLPVSLHPTLASPAAAARKPVHDPPSWAKHSDSLLDLLCVRLV